MHTPPLWCGVVAVLLARPTFAQTTPEALRARIEALHDAPRTPIAGRTLVNPDAVAHFLGARGFTPPWNADAIAEICNAIRHIDADGLNPADYHLAAIGVRLTSAAAAIDQQILVSDAVATLIDHVRYGKVRPSSLDSTYDPALEVAVKKFQDQHRLTADGVIGRSTIDAMNILAEIRADQARVNLERVRWIVQGYWTVSVGASGGVRFARDVYGRDAAVLRALDAAPVPSAGR